MRNPRTVILAVSIALISIVLLLLPSVISGIVSALIVTRSVNSQTEELVRLIESESSRTASPESASEAVSEGLADGILEVVTVPDPPSSLTSTDAAISTRRAIATVDIFAKVVGTPIAMAFAPDGRIFYTELKTGEIRVLDQSGTPQGTLATLPILPDGDEQGLLGLALDPDFESNGFLYTYYSYQFGGESFNRLVRVQERPDGDPVVETILDEIPGSNLHNGGSIVVGTDGKLYVSVGETGTPASSQSLENLNGKILRLNLNGSVPDDNPMQGNPIYAWGFRNPFGMTLDLDTSAIYATENGPDCCDEINIVKANANYGWPLARGIDEESEFENPIYVWEPRTVAPTIPVFYNGSNYGPDFEDSLMVGTFNTAQLFLFDKKFLSDPGAGSPQVLTRLTTPIIGGFESPDGALYLTTRGVIYKVSSLDTALVSSIDFRDGHSSDRLLAGWHGHEMGGRSTAFRWTSGRSGAELPRTSEVGDGWLRIVGSARLDVHDGGSVIIVVTLNGVTIGEAEVTEEGEFRISLPVSGSALTENTPTRVTLEISPTFVPAEDVPESTDRRELGVKVNSISLVIP